MADFLALPFIALAFYLCYPSRRYKAGKPIRRAGHFHSSGYSGRPYYNPDMMKGARWWKR